MPSVFDTAKYILEKQGPMSTMKLQKLCYYAQAWSLVWDDNELFPEDFEAWKSGPVCRSLFEQTKGMFKVSVQDEPGDSENLSADQKESIDAVVDYYGDKDAQYLSSLSHLEDPWKLAGTDQDDDSCCGSIVTKESMALYYSSLD